MSTTSNEIAVAVIPANVFEAVSVKVISPSLSSMYPVIGCSLVERVQVAGIKEATLWVDEEGICNGKPLNLRASIIAGQPLFGDAIMAGDNGSSVTSLSIPCPKMYFDIVQKEAMEYFVAAEKA